MSEEVNLKCPSCGYKGSILVRGTRAVTCAMDSKARPAVFLAEGEFESDSSSYTQCLKCKHMAARFYFEYNVDETTGRVRPNHAGA